MITFGDEMETNLSLEKYSQKIWEIWGQGTIFSCKMIHYGSY
jgi:hypothetical protein